MLFLNFFQLCDFGQSVVWDDGKMCISSPGPSNIYLPYLSILDQATLQIGKSRIIPFPLHFFPLLCEKDKLSLAVVAAL